MRPGSGTYNLADAARPPIRPHAVLPRHQGHRPRGVGPALPGRLQHHRFAAVRRPARATTPPACSSCACTSQAPPHLADAGARCSTLFAHTRAAVRHGRCASTRWPRAPRAAADGQPARPLPERPAVPLEERPARGGHPGHRLQPPRLRRRWPPATASPSTTCRCRPAATPRAKRAQEQQVEAHHRPRAHRPGRAGALHADPERRVLRRAGAAARSTSTTASCPASRARGPTSRRTRAASS